MTDKCPRCGGPVEVKKDPEGRDLEICRDCSVPFRVVHTPMDIVALAQELQRLRESSFDVVSATKDLKMVPAESGVKLEVEGYGSYPLTRWGHSQVAEKTGIPFRYYEAMRQAGMNGLLAANVNSWLVRQADRRLVRVADGNVRALLSDRYRVLDNYDLAILVMERAKDHAAVVQRCDLTETSMYIKLVVPEYRDYLDRNPPGAHVAHHIPKDEVIPGLVVSNSEVGTGAFRVEPFLLRTVCSNGLIGEDTLYRVHLGTRMEIGQLIYTDETRKLADQALWAQVRDIVDATFDTRMLRHLIEKMQTAQGQPIGKPTEVLDATAKNLQLSEEKRASLFDYFSKEGATLFGLVNGITRLAQDFEDVEQQVKLERYAGQVLEAGVPA